MYEITKAIPHSQGGRRNSSSYEHSIL